MFLNLFLKECKMLGKNILYIAFAVILLLFYTSQYESDTYSEIKEVKTGNRESGSENYKVINPLIAPKESDGFYGNKAAEIPEQVMPRVICQLYVEARFNSYEAYPYGFFKSVKLNAKKQARVSEIFKELTGYTVDEITAQLKDIEIKKIQSWGNTEKQADEIYKVLSKAIVRSMGYEEYIPMNKDLTYERFKGLMVELEDMIGAMSAYSNLERYGSVEVTYEEALTEYENLVQKDHVSGAYARLFCDYMGIVMAFFPVFVVVAYALKDKRAKMQELIYSRKETSICIVGSRQLALVVMMFVPVLLLAAVSTVELFIGVKPLGVPFDWLAFMKYSIIMVLPTLLVTVGLGYFMTELTQSAIGIAVQGVIWFLCIAGTQLSGDYSYSLIIRHNIVGEYDLFTAAMKAIAVNRIGYTLLALGLFFITVILFGLKRSGRWYAKRKPYKVSHNNKKEFLD